MFIDASAMVAILATEPDGETLANRLQAAERRFTSAVAIFETVTALVRKKNYTVTEAGARVRQFLDEASVRVAAIADAEDKAALAAFDRYGKGRHPAALNMGDCFAYACAKTLGVPLLYKGADFARTDLAG